MKNPSDPIGDRTRDLPACSAPLLVTVGSSKGGHVAVLRVDILDVTHWSMRGSVGYLLAERLPAESYTYLAACRWGSKCISTRNGCFYVPLTG
jgi:hypothetical protein